MADIDMDTQRKQRIAKWTNDKGVALFGDYNGEVDDADLKAILLDFWKFLDECEVERQRQ